MGAEVKLQDVDDLLGIIRRLKEELSRYEAFLLDARKKLVENNPGHAYLKHVIVPQNEIRVLEQKAQNVLKRWTERK